jgi:hypothetical protein
MSVLEFVTGGWTWQQLSSEMLHLFVLGVGCYAAGHARGWNRGYSTGVSICTTRSK